VREREILIEREGGRRKNRLNEHYFRIYQTRTGDGAAVAAPVLRWCSGKGV